MDWCFQRDNEAEIFIKRIGKSLLEEIIQLANGTAIVLELQQMINSTTIPVELSDIDISIS